jgi:hypothetical protein
VRCTLYPVLPISFVCVTKETGERKVRRSIAARLFTLRFSHRFQRIAKAPLIWYSASPNGLGIIFIKNYMLYKMADPHPVRHDGANPTQAGGRYALDSEIPLLALVGRIPRTGFAGCCGRPLRVAFLQTSCLRLKRLDGGSPTALVSDCVGRLNGFILHSSFSEEVK